MTRWTWSVAVQLGQVCYVDVRVPRLWSRRGGNDLAYVLGVGLYSLHVELCLSVEWYHDA